MVFQLSKQKRTYFSCCTLWGHHVRGFRKALCASTLQQRSRFVKGQTSVDSSLLPLADDSEEESHSTVIGNPMPKCPIYLPPFRIPEPRYPSFASARARTPSPKTPLPFRMRRGLHIPLRPPPPAPDWVNDAATPRQRNNAAIHK